MQKPIRFKKYVSLPHKYWGVLAAGAKLQSEYSVVTKRQEARIFDGLRDGRYLEELDLYHFNDSHTNLIRYATDNFLIGARETHARSVSWHIGKMVPIMLRHSLEFGNVRLANQLLEYVLLSFDADEGLISKYARAIDPIFMPYDFVMPADPVEAIRRRCCVTERAETLHRVLSEKPALTSKPKPLKV